MIIIIYYLFIYLFGNYLHPATVGSARINVKEREKKERQVRRMKERKGIEAPRVKYPTPSRATDALIGDEEQNGKQKKLKKKRNRGRVPIPATLDHSVASYDAQKSYDEPIRFTYHGQLMCS